MSPVSFFCDYNCVHCWRSLSFTLPPKNFVWDSPESIVDGCIQEHVRYLQGFKATVKNGEKFKESEYPKHFAISLSGEPTLYPYLPQMIDLIKQKGMTSFLVTNGAHPDKLQFLLRHPPTNLYVTLHAPNKEVFEKECCPIISDGWENLMTALALLKKFECNTVIRLTLSKATNMTSPEQYAKLIESAQPKFVEVKGYMAVGGARVKMGLKAMPFFKEIVAFAKAIEQHSSYRIINEKINSNVILLTKEKND